MDPKMNSNTELPITYAAILKNVQPRKRCISECARKTWYEEVEEFEWEQSMKRTGSLLKIPHNDEMTGLRTMHTEPQITSSLSSSRTVSNESLHRKMSIEFDSCAGTSEVYTSSEENHSEDQLYDGNRLNLSFKRRSSVDSHRTTSSSGCSLTTDCKSRTESSSSDKVPETDEGILRRRQKQIDYGKRTIGYRNYVNKVPKMERKKNDPRTPNKHIKYSRRAFDGVIKVWRKQLHLYDPSEPVDTIAMEQ